MSSHASISLASYSRDGVRYFQCHVNGMPTHAELTTRRIALEAVRDNVRYYRRKGRPCHYSRWDGDRGEIRRTFAYGPLP